MSNRKKAAPTVAKNVSTKVVNGPYEKINIVGDSPRNGIFDPSIEYDQYEVGWLAYSAIEGNDPQAGPYISTKLAKTTDLGKTWVFQKTINQSFDASIDYIDGTKKTGVWRYEVPALVFDPGDKGSEWKLFSHRYFWTKADDRLAAYGWISYRSAPSPMGPWSEETPLFGAGKFPPSPYNKTKVNLNNLNSSLKNALAYSEPGVVATDNSLFLTLSMIDKEGPEKIILLKSSDHAKSWQFVKTLLTRADAKKFGYVYFDASSLSVEDTSVYLLATPGKKGLAHDGTFIFKFENIGKGELQKDSNGKPVVVKQVKLDDSFIAPRGGGQSDYADDNSVGGMIFPQFNQKAYPEVFQIFSTKDPNLD